MNGVKIVFASGGTGGHLYPALAIAEELKKLRPTWRITFIGRTRSFEEEKVRDSEYHFFPISARGWSRQDMKKNLFVPFVLTLSVLRVALHLLFHRPKAVLGTGGFVSAPVIGAAKLLRIPFALQEQNAYPGWVTRWAARKARRIFLAYGEAAQYLTAKKRNIKTPGLPIRPLPESIDKVALLARHGLVEGRPVFLCFGGSQGSHTLNDWMRKACPRIISEANAQIVWQTGYSEWQLQQLHPASQIPGVKVIPYLDPIYEFLAIADLILCRAGASTLAEITAFGLPALMVPYPHATDNHQEKNARLIEKQGAGYCLLEENTTPEKVCQMAVALLQDSALLSCMRQKSKALGRPQAALETTQEFIRMVEEL